MKQLTIKKAAAEKTAVTTAKAAWLSKVICFVLCAAMAAATGLAALTAGSTRVEAAESAEEGKTQATELEQLIADWGEPAVGLGGKTEYTIDFEDYDEGTDFSQLDDLLEDWSINNATGDHITKVASNGTNKYLEFAPFAQMYLSEGITNKYVYSCDFKAPENQGFGIFFRSSDDIGINPFFEDDQSGLGIMGLGPAGVYIIPNGKTVKIYVKYYDERKPSDAGGKYLNNKSISFKSPASFTEDFQRVSIADYGTGAKVFINGALLATLEYSELVDGYDELLSEYKYYSNVKVYDAEGKQKADVKNALVCADFSVLAVGMRINSGEVDNIAITQYEEKIAGVEIDSASKTEYLVGDNYASNISLVVTYESGATKKNAVGTEMLEGFDTSAAGEKTVKINYKGFEKELTISVKEAPVPTEAPQPTEAPKPTDAPKNNGGEDDQSGNKKALTVGLIAGGVLIAAIAVVAVLLSLKKKK